MCENNPVGVFSHTRLTECPYEVVDDRREETARARRVHTRGRISWGLLQREIRDAQRPSGVAYCRARLTHKSARTRRGGTKKLTKAYWFSIKFGISTQNLLAERRAWQKAARDLSCPPSIWRGLLPCEIEGAREGHPRGSPMVTFGPTTHSFRAICQKLSAFAFHPKAAAFGSSAEQRL